MSEKSAFDMTDEEYEAARQQMAQGEEEEVVEEQEVDEGPEEGTAEWYKQRLEALERDAKGKERYVVEQRHRRQEAERQAEELNKRLQSVIDRLDAQSKPPEEEIDPEVDPARYIAKTVEDRFKAVDEKLSAWDERYNQTQQLTQQQQAQAATMQWANQNVAQSIGDNEEAYKEYQKAAEFALRKTQEVAQLQGHDPEQYAAAAIGGVLKRAYENNESIVDIVKEVATGLGYNPQAQKAGDSKPKSQKAKKSEMRSLSGASGGSGAGRRVMLTELNDIDDATFAKIHSDHRLWRKINEEGHVYL